MQNITRLLELARDNDMPVVYTKGEVVDKYHSGDSVRARGPTRSSTSTVRRSCLRSRRCETEYVVEKAKASAFFGTPLSSYSPRHGSTR